MSDAQSGPRLPGNFRTEDLERFLKSGQEFVPVFGPEVSTAPIPGSVQQLALHRQYLEYERLQKDLAHQQKDGHWVRSVAKGTQLLPPGHNLKLDAWKHPLLQAAARVARLMCTAWSRSRYFEPRAIGTNGPVPESHYTDLREDLETAIADLRDAARDARPMINELLSDTKDSGSGGLEQQIIRLQREVLGEKPTGITLMQLRWLEALVKYIVAARPCEQAYLEQDELAVALSMRDYVDGINDCVLPDMGHINYYWSHSVEDVRKVLECSDRAEQGGFRAQSEFHLAVANLLVRDSTGVALSYCWDMDLPRALATRVNDMSTSFCLVAPWQRQNSSESDPFWLAIVVDGLDSKGKLKVSQPAVLLPYKEEGLLGSEPPLDRPWLVCLAGSPLVDIDPSLLVGISVDGANVEAVEASIRLGEPDVWDLAGRSGSLPSGVLNRLGGRQLLVFGHPVSRSRDRIQYHGWSSLKRDSDLSVFSMDKKKTPFERRALHKLRVGCSEFDLMTAIREVQKHAASLD